MGATAKPVRWKHRRRRPHQVLWFVISGVVVLIGLGSLAVQGLNRGIDFKGGTRLDVRADGARGRTVDEIRDIAKRSTPSLGDAVIRGTGAPVSSDHYRASRWRRRRSRRRTSSNFRFALLEEVRRQGGPRTSSRRPPCPARSAGDPAVGAILAFIFSMFLIVAYLAFRFDWRYAVPTIVALLHDLIITIGVYSITGREVTSATVAAVLTVLGYSLYDTIIVFDRVRENERAAAQAHVRPDREHLALGDADALAEHVAHHAVADRSSLFVFGGDDVEGLRVRAADRHRLRRLLVVLHRRPLLVLLKRREPEFGSAQGSDELPAIFLRSKAAPAPAAAAPAPAGAQRRHRRRPPAVAGTNGAAKAPTGGRRPHPGRPRPPRRPQAPPLGRRDRARRRRPTRAIRFGCATRRRSLPVRGVRAPATRARRLARDGRRAGAARPRRRRRGARVPGPARAAARPARARRHGRRL